jgi:hypothetical protein
LPAGNWVPLAQAVEGGIAAQFDEPLEPDQRTTFYTDGENRLAQCVSCGAQGRNRVSSLVIVDVTKTTSEVIAATCGPY